MLLYLTNWTTSRKDDKMIKPIPSHLSNEKEEFFLIDRLRMGKILS